MTAVSEAKRLTNDDRSRFELNRAIWALSFRRVNGTELELPPLAISWGVGVRIFWPEAGILVRRRSLGKSKKACQVPENRTFLRLRR